MQAMSYFIILLLKRQRVHSRLFLDISKIPPEVAEGPCHNTEVEELVAVAEYVALARAEPLWYLEGIEQTPEDVDPTAYHVKGKARAGGHGAEAVDGYEVPQGKS